MKKIVLSLSILFVSIGCAFAESVGIIQSDTISIIITATVSNTECAEIIPGPPVDINNSRAADVDLSVYPNPASNSLNLKLKTASEIKSEAVHIIVYDMKGRIVMEQKDRSLPGIMYQKNLNVRVLPQGDYTVKLVKGKYSPIKKFRVFY
jgi:hypothetical protein